MVGSLVVVNLMDRYRGMNNVGLDSLLMDDRLDSLMDVVMLVLATNGRCDAAASGCWCDNTLVLKLRLFGLQIPLCGIVVTVVEFAVLYTTQLRSVLFWEDFAVMNWLDCSMIVILVNFPVDGSVDLLMLVRLHSLLLNTGCYCLVDGSIVMTGTANEITDCCLRLVHCDCRLGLVGLN